MSENNVKYIDQYKGPLTRCRSSGGDHGAACSISTVLERISSCSLYNCWGYECKTHSEGHEALEGLVGVLVRVGEAALNAQQTADS